MQYGKDYKKSEELEWLNPFNLGGRDVYILDFSFPRDVMDFIFANAKKVIWLDHHQTAFEMWGVQKGQRVYLEDSRYHNNSTDYSRYIKLHNDKSGAYLAWEYFHGDVEIPILIRHIDEMVTTT